MRVLQLRLRLALKDNEIERQVKIQLDLKKEVEKEKQQLVDVRAPVDSLKNTVRSLQEDVSKLQDVNSEQKVSLLAQFCLNIYKSSR